MQFSSRAGYDEGRSCTDRRTKDVMIGAVRELRVSGSDAVEEQEVGDNVKVSQNVNVHVEYS